MNVLSLNHDVLSHILSFLVAKDALNLSVTSRKIYSIARRHAFSAVSLTSPAQLAEFCAYMLADVANRLFWLRDLEVCTSAFGVTSGEELEEEEGLVYLQDAALLAGLFAQATMLKCLSVSCIEVLVMSDSRIVEALIALPGLNKLQLSGTGPFTGQMLNKLRSRPRKLLLSFMERPSQSPLFFEHFASLQSLHVLDLWNIKLDEFPPSQNGALLQCPTVQHLSITASVAPMSLFVRAFPNLRTLLLWCVTAASLSPVTVTEDECWHRLNHVGGYTRDFTYWRVACPVRWLELDVAITDDTQVELVISAVRDMTPIILSLNIYLYTELSFWTSLAGAVPRLKYLDLVAMNWSISRCQRWLDQVPPTLRTLKLICVRVYVSLPALHSALGEPTSLIWRETFKHKLPWILAGSIPSLRYVALELEADGRTPLITRPRIARTQEERRPEHASWWRITRSTEGCRNWRRTSVLGFMHTYTL